MECELEAKELSEISVSVNVGAVVGAEVIVVSYRGVCAAVKEQFAEGGVTVFGGVVKGSAAELVLFVDDF